jgi:hypothetical protein
MGLGQRRPEEAALSGLAPGTHRWPREGCTPPNLAFPVVWLVIFTLNTVAGRLVWSVAATNALPTLPIYAASGEAAHVS